MTIEKIKVSRDNGKTWNIEEINIKQLNPKLSALKVGDLIERNGIKYEIKLTTSTPEEHKNNKCFKVFEQFENMLYASSIIETEETTEEVKNETIQESPAQPTQNEQTYIAYNRSFSSYELAYNHCIQCDFDPAYITTEEPLMASQTSTIKPEQAEDPEVFYLYSKTFNTYHEAANYVIKNRINDDMDMIISNKAIITNEQLLKLKKEYITSKSTMSYDNVLTYYNHLLTVPNNLHVENILYSLKRLKERHESRIEAEKQLKEQQINIMIY